jgi:hypothetical protein
MGMKLMEVIFIYQEKDLDILILLEISITDINYLVLKLFLVEDVQLFANSYCAHHPLLLFAIHPMLKKISHSMGKSTQSLE